MTHNHRFLLLLLLLLLPHHGVISHCYSPIIDSSFTCKTIHKSSLSDDPTDNRFLDTEPLIMLLLSPHPHVLQIHKSKINQAPKFVIDDSGFSSSSPARNL
ncbi:Phosphoenolpyruvate carboxylase kinase 1 [Linum grandiflorum]